MKIYIVKSVRNLDFYPDYIELHYCTSYEKAIEFLRFAIKDATSGVDEDTIIDISVGILDEYFSPEAKSVERKTVKEFLE